MKFTPEGLPDTNSTIREIIDAELARKEMVFDNSIIKVWSLCRRKFLYRKILKLVQRKEALALSFGSAFHAALDTYYSAQPLLFKLESSKEREDLKARVYVEAMKAFAARATDELSKLPVHMDETEENGAKPEHSLEFGLQLCAKYFQHYPLDTESFRIMVDEEKNSAMTEVGWALHLPNGCVVGKMDGVIDDGDLLENKTTSATINEIFLSQYTVNSQVSLYLAALRELLGRTPKKALMNIIRVKDYKKKTDDKENKLWGRTIIRKTDAQLDDTLDQFNFIIGEIKHALKVGFPAFYQNGPDACQQYFRQCEYFPLCQAQDAHLIEILMYGDYVQREWLPYEIGDLKESELIDLEVR